MTRGEDIAILESKTGKTTPPGPSDPFGKYFILRGWCEAQTRPETFADLASEMFPQDPTNPVFHSLHHDARGTPMINTSWCVFPIGETRPRHVQMAISPPNLDIQGTPRAKFRATDKEILHATIFGGKDNVDNTKQLNAYIGSLDVPGQAGHAMAVCIPENHQHMGEILSRIRLKKLFETGESNQRAPYLFKITVVYKSKDGNSSKCGIPLTSNLFYSLFWGDTRFMPLRITFVPSRRNMTRQGSTSTGATAGGTASGSGSGSAATHATTPGGIPGVGMHSSPSVTQFRAETTPSGMGKGLMTIRTIHNDLINDARDKIGDLLKACLEDKDSDMEYIKSSMLILGCLARDAGHLLGGGDHLPERLSPGDFEEIIRKLTVALGIPAGAISPCEVLSRTFGYHLAQDNGAFNAFSRLVPEETTSAITVSGTDQSGCDTEMTDI